MEWDILRFCLPIMPGTISDLNSRCLRVTTLSTGTMLQTLLIKLYIICLLKNLLTQIFSLILSPSRSVLHVDVIQSQDILTTMLA